MFAESIGLTSAELSEALKKGEISAEQFVTNFANLLRTKFEPAAKRIADSPAEAGARLQTALTGLQNSLGKLLGPIGAAFQDTFTAIAEDITKAADALARFFGIGLENQIAKVEQQLQAAQTTAARFLDATDPRGINNRNRANNRVGVLQQELDLLKAQQALTQGDGLVKPKPTGLENTSITTQLDKDKLQTGEELARILTREIRLLEAKTALEKELLNIQFAEEDRAREILRIEEARREELTALSAQLAASQAGQAIGSALGEDLVEVLNDVDALKEAFSDLGRELAKMIPENPIKQYIEQLRDELDGTKTMIVSLAQTVETEFASAMSGAITGLITGTQTAQEAFAEMFSNIGKAFTDMATQMIAKALVMKALNILFPGAAPTAAPTPTADLFNSAPQASTTSGQ